LEGAIASISREIVGSSFRWVLDTMRPDHVLG
jgi:hypothetical protein